MFFHGGELVQVDILKKYSSCVTLSKKIECYPSMSPWLNVMDSRHSKKANSNTQYLSDLVNHEGV